MLSALSSSAKKLIGVHTITAMLAFLIGTALLFFRTEADFYHILMGRLFSVLMIICVLVTFFIRDLSGSYNILHVLSMLTLFWIIKGWYYAYFKPTKLWKPYHVEAMAGAYAALIVAGIGVVGRHYLKRRESKVHWTWFILLGVVVVAPSHVLYISSFKKPAVTT
jgi:uncharacterized membrane protein